MKTIAIGGEPALIAQMLTKIYRDNPDMEIVSTCVTSHVVQQQSPKIALNQPAQPIIINVFYLTYERMTRADDTLEDENGKPLNF